MKHILVILFSIVTLSAFGQQGSASFSVLRQKLTATSGDTTSSAFNTAVSNAVSSGYAVQFWNNVANTPHYDFINSEGTQHVFSFSGAGGSFWKTAGSTPLTASTTIAGGGFPLFFTNLDSIRVFTNGGQQFIADNGGILFDASDSIRFSVQHFHIEATHGILLDSDPGTAGQVLTSGGTNTPATWVTPSTGVTAPGSTGNVPFKSAGGGFQAETALNYDSATNTLDADIVTVNDDAYSESGWNGSVAVPTKNAIRDKIESMYNADLTAIANMAPANGDFIYRESGTWVKKTTAETAAIIYAVGGDPAFITNLSIHGDAGAGVILTNQANTEQGFNNTGRTTRYFDATGYNYIQVACQVSTLSASANTPRLYPRYSTDNSTYNLIGSGSGTNIIDLSSTGHKLTDWIALPTGAKALVYFSVGQNGGNGTADPEIGYLEVRLKK